MVDFYMLHYPEQVNDQRVYKQIGKDLFEKYPCIRRYILPELDLDIDLDYMSFMICQNIVTA